ncbi:dual specificity phosphatase [Histoplasma capsulatum G186AR]|uniref:Dual specificity phosphatase n=1 Tax=Ajellomyces capsulatus (strain G186AR / H82 / ATCC MYA-2454 / RMSCC 2432) TaxID=447093 RepID=C0NBL3_AJECG|nr:dual specificity phosphatase [Histoplasma capsulatum G186AR]EEH11054.1 dual specificity phosphatase [Histoplasma capsulatum G186AR]
MPMSASTTPTQSPLPSSTLPTSVVSRFFSPISAIIHFSSDYISRGCSRLHLLSCINAAPSKTSGGDFAPSEVTSVFCKSVGIPVIVAMTGCFLLLCALCAPRGGKKDSHVLLGKQPSTSNSDGGSNDDMDVSVKEKDKALDVYGRSVSSRSAHLKRNGVHDTDPGLLKKHSANISYTTPIATYPSIRTFLYPHPHIEELPTEPSPLPLLVFIHGLGGSLTQFHPLLTSLVNVAPCFGIDLPGCGLSSFSPKSWAAYSVEALATLLAVAIDQYRDKERGQKIVLIAHSLGCSLSALIASSESPLMLSLQEHIIGLIAVCPPAGHPLEKTTESFRRLLYIPNPIFDLFRRWDRRGGPNSPSVMSFGSTSRITKPEEVTKILEYFNRDHGTLPIFPESQPARGGVGDENTPPDARPSLKGRVGRNLTNTVSPSGLSKPENTTSGGKKGIKAYIFPAPASHALLYDRHTCRTLSGLIQDFFPKYIDPRLSLGWQLQHLTTSKKWDVKNLEKWKAIDSVSDVMGDTFVAMKTLREVDEIHTPIPFAQKWKGRIYAVIDISHESPVYDPTQLEKSGIQYHKLPTVSKIPPTIDEVRDFVSLVVRLEEEISAISNALPDGALRPVLGVHCHYGFNRTGFFVVSYLIEKKGFSVQGAIDEFERCRPPGIKHEHFIDTLFVRYCVGLQRASTL